MEMSRGGSLQDSSQEDSLGLSQWYTEIVEWMELSHVTNLGVSYNEDKRQITASHISVTQITVWLMVPLTELGARWHGDRLYRNHDVK